MITTAEAVIIGAGSFGTSLAWHLAKMGMRDVVLLDRFGVASQTSPRAAGLTQQIRPEREMTLLAKRSVEKLVRFEEETGVPLEVHQAGSVKMARDAAGAAQVAAELVAGRDLGLDIRPFTAEELAARAPWARADGVQAMWITESDCYLEPRLLPLAYAEAARRAGVTVLEGTPVTGIEREQGRISGVTTSAGTIATPIVIDTAGAWTRQVADEAGIRIPVVPMRHQLFITEPNPLVHAAQPICRVIDANVYVRPCWGGLMLGGYESNPLPLDPRTMAPGFQIADMPLDLGVVRSLAAAVRAQFPGLETVPIREHRGGLPTMTADGRHIVGAAPNVAGFYTATGCCVGGLSISPAIGEQLAQLILTGASDIPLALMALDRFTRELSDADLLAACAHSYAHHYAEGWGSAGKAG